MPAITETIIAVSGSGKIVDLFSKFALINAFALITGMQTSLVLAEPALEAELDREAQPHTMLVRHPKLGGEGDQRNDYYLAALELALEKSRAEYGEYQLEAAPMSIPQGRILRMISSKEGVDVMWSMTSKEREAFLQPVRFPLLKGLTGYRVLIVRAENQDDFRSVRTIAQLAEKTAGQQSDWPDTDILRANSLPVTTGDYDMLFAMLNRGRLDYIPRAINEPWNEVKQRPELNLVVDRYLLLHYPTANYFFVHKDNHQLAERLAFGLNAALEDGSFDDLFYGHPTNVDAFPRSGLLERRIIRLKNPFLPRQTPMDDMRLWWSPGAPRSSLPELDEDNAETDPEDNYESAP